MFDEVFITEQRRKLLAERDRFEQELRRLHIPLVGDPQDVDDVAEQSEELSVRSGEAEALEGQLKLVTRSLEKIDRGSYGMCETCRNYIEKERLVSDPIATHCERCES